MLLFPVEQVSGVLEQIAGYRAHGLAMTESTDQLLKNHPEVIDTPLRQLILFTIQMLWLTWDREEDDYKEEVHKTSGVCKFCGIEFRDNGPRMYQHQGELVCEDCWDERLRTTE